MDKSQGSDDFQVSNSVVIQNVIIWLQTCPTAVIAVLLYFCIFHQPAEKYGSSTTLNPIYTQIDQQLNNSTYITTGAKPTKPEYVAPIIWSIACCVCIIIALRIYNSVKKPVANNILREWVVPFLSTLQVLLFAIGIDFLVSAGFLTGVIDLEESWRHQSFDGCIISIAITFPLLMGLEHLAFGSQQNMWVAAGFALFCFFDTLSVYFHLNILYKDSWGLVGKCLKDSGYLNAILILPSFFALIPSLLFLAQSFAAREKKKAALIIHSIYLGCSFLLNGSSIILLAHLMEHCNSGISYEFVKNCSFTLGLLGYLIYQYIRPTSQSGNNDQDICVPNEILCDEAAQP